MSKGSKREGGRRAAADPAPSAWVPAKVEPRGAAPLRLGEVLVGAQKFLARQSGAPMTQDEWRRIVGEKIASRTRLGRLTRGVLTVKVASSAWSNELSFLRVQILGQLQQRGHEVTGLRFKVDQILAGQDARPRRSRPGDASSSCFATAAPAPLPPELLERLERIEDPNLRAAIAEAARASLRRTPGSSPR